MTTTTLACVSSPAANTVRSAVCFPGKPWYGATTRWSVRSECEVWTMSASVNEAARISSGVPSVEPPSELIMTVRRRGKSRVKHTLTARTTSAIVAALFKVGSPTRMSTWPTAISCRRSASETMRRRRRCRGIAEQPAQPEPIEIVGPHHHDVRLPPDARKDAAAEHLDRDGAGEPRQVELHDLRGSGEIADHEHGVASERPRERQHAMVGGLEKLDRAAAEHLGRTAAPQSGAGSSSGATSAFRCWDSTLTD